MASKSKPIKLNRTAIANGFKQFLATTYCLYLKTQNFHWNVTGPTFSMLHAFFQTQYEELADAADLIAERIRALDYFSPGSFTEFSKLSQIKDTVGKKAAVQMLKELLADHRSLVALITELMVVAQNCHDEASNDILIERLRSHEKTIWMLQSHLMK